MSTSAYLYSQEKRILDYTLAVFGLLPLFFLFLIIYLITKITDNGPVFFFQKRTGKNGKEFSLFKFRTMIVDAEKLRNKYKKLNVADGPVFKIPNDPRYTKFGKILVKTGLDELPQVINILKGEMSLVGPRPLPVYEENKLTRAQKVRELVLPGITSSWVISGAHRLKFKKWIELDKEYIKHATLIVDIKIMVQTFLLILKLSINRLLQLLR